MSSAGEGNPLNALDTALGLYDMGEQGTAFIKAQTGIEDEEELKKHILAVRAEGYSVRLHCCSNVCAFVLNVMRLRSFLDPPLPLPSALCLPPVSRFK